MRLKKGEEQQKERRRNDGEGKVADQTTNDVAGRFAIGIRRGE